MSYIAFGIMAGVVGGIIGGIVGPLLVVLFMPRKKCPECAATLTRMRNCWDTARVVRRCQACGCGVDVRGQKVAHADRIGSSTHYEARRS